MINAILIMIIIFNLILLAALISPKRSGCVTYETDEADLIKKFEEFRRSENTPIEKHYPEPKERD